MTPSSRARRTRAAALVDGTVLAMPPLSARSLAGSEGGSGDTGKDVGDHDVTVEIS